MSIILDEAKKVVYERNATYGQPEDNFAITAELWSAYLGVPIQPEDVGMMMILLKVARERYQHKQDNLVDIAGYAECVARLHEKSDDTSTSTLPLERLRAIGRLMGFQSKDGYDPRLNVRCAGCGRVVPDKLAVLSDGLMYCLQCNEEFSKTGRSMTDDSK